MKKSVLQKISVLVCVAMTSVACAATPIKKPVTIGIVVPMALPAMTQIVKGFETTLTRASSVPVTYLVKNAQGDENMQRSILQEFNSANVTLVAPIGTDASQMAMTMIRDKPIVGIAADHLKEQAKKANNPNVTGVNSRVAPADRMNSIHAALPHLHKLTLIYSADARLFNQVKAFERVAKKDHIQVQPLMVSQLSDLYSVRNTTAHNSQAIFILKDEMVVSGINTLLQQAAVRHIPVIASDDGSVAKGAAFALGVSEYQTGVDAAKVALQILHGKKPSDMPVHMMTHYFIFLNAAAAQKQGVNVALVRTAAKRLGYRVQMCV